MSREGRLGLFDRFASTASGFVSRAPFFAGCVLLVIIWFPSYFLMPSLDTWQLLINTATTIVTFLLVALLQNAQSRSDAAMHEKLNVMADALADLMDAMSTDDSSLQDDRRELIDAVGLEDRVSSGRS